MIQDVVELRAKLQLESFTDPESFIEAKVDAPRARPSQQVALRDFRIIEHVSAQRRGAKRIRIEEPIPRTHVRIACHNGAERRAPEAPDRVYGTAANVARKERVAIATFPVRGEAETALGKHIPRHLPPADEGVDKGRGRGAKLAPLAEWRFDDAVGDEPVTGNEGLITKVRFRLELVVNRPAQAGIARIGGARLLVE